MLAKVGGFEIGAIAGLIIGAAAHRKPVIIDGFIATAGAMIAYSLEPFVRDYIICSHRSVEPGHGALLEKLQRRPLLDLNLRLGEGTGAASPCIWWRRRLPFSPKWPPLPRPGSPDPPDWFRGWRGNSLGTKNCIMWDWFLTPMAEHVSL